MENKRAKKNAPTFLIIIQELNQDIYSFQSENRKLKHQILPESESRTVTKYLKDKASRCKKFIRLCVNC